MDEGWHKIYEDNDLTRIHLVSSRLKNEGIENIILNKIDSLYGQIGLAELYVRKEMVMKAVQLLEKEENSDFDNNHNLTDEPRSDH